MTRPFLAVLLLLAVAGCDSSTAPSESVTSVTVNEETLEPYQSDDLGFVVRYPAGWVVTPEPESGLVTFSAATPEGGFTDNFNVAVGSVPEEIPAPAYYEGELGRLRNFLQDIEVIEEADVQVQESVVGRGITLTADIGDTRVGVSRLIVLDRGRAWEMTFFTPADRLERMAPLIREVFESFTLLR